MTFWIYILRCSDDSYYTGHTDNLEKRIAEHVNGAITSCYTFKRRPLALVFSQEFSTREEALASEQQIKKWSRKKKEAMIRGDWNEVSRLARSNSVHGSISSVHPELVEGAVLGSISSVHPELVEGAVHGSTSSPRTKIDSPQTQTQEKAQR